MAQLFVKRLTVIDFSYLDAERGLVGESWQVDIELTGGLDQQGMVLDFAEVKKTVKRLIDDNFDHRLLVPAQHPELAIWKANTITELSFPLNSGALIRHRSPQDAINLVPAETITPDSLVPAIIGTLTPEMPRNVTEIRLRLWPEHCDDAYYHYSHGLKHHCGNCQRIAHGHRSRLEILRNGERDRTLEQEWSRIWRDVYIGSREDLNKQQGDNLIFNYRSEQGEFSLSLPKPACYLVDTDSTVENLAQHIADTLKARFPLDAFRVYAYEGVDKGAVGSA